MNVITKGGYPAIKTKEKRLDEKIQENLRMGDGVLPLKCNYLITSPQRHTEGEIELKFVLD